MFASQLDNEMRCLELVREAERYQLAKFAQGAPDKPNFWQRIRTRMSATTIQPSAIPCQSEAITQVNLSSIALR